MSPRLASLAMLALACGGSGGHGSSQDAPPTGDATPTGDAAPPDSPVPVDAPCGSACAPLTTSWQVTYGGSGFGNTVEGIFVDGAGNTYIAGMFEGTIDLGGGAFTDAGLDDILVASFDPAGTFRWAQHFGGSGDDQATAITVAAGKVYVAGVFTGDVAFGSATLHGAGRDDCVYMVFDAATGALLDARGFGTPGDDGFLGVAVDATGNITLGGQFSKGTLALAGSAVTGAADDNAFLVSFTAAGAHRWSRMLAGSAPKAPATSAFDDAQSVAVDAAGNVTVVGEWMGTADFGSGTITSSDAQNLDFDAFAASYTSTGAPRWSRSFGSNSGDFGTSARSLAIDASGTGDVVVSGGFHGTVDFGGAAPLVQQGIVDGFVVVLSNTTGASQMARSLGDPSASLASAVRFDSHGDVVVAGRMDGSSTDLGDGVVLPSAGGIDGDADDTFIAGFDHATGAARFGRRYGGPGPDTYAEPLALALSIHDSMAVGGVCNGPVDLGLGALTTGPDATGYAILVTR